MPIHYITGDVTKPVGDLSKVVIHVCNDIGAWGAGVSGAIGRRWPKAERAYRRWASYKGHQNVGPQFKLGRIQIVQVEESLFETIRVVNLIGQHRLRSRENPCPVRYDAIKDGLQELFDRGSVDSRDVAVHMPRIGCGLAGGQWFDIEPIVHKELCDKGVVVYVYDLENS